MSRLTSPAIILTVGYIQLIAVSIIAHFSGVYDNNDFFRWGPPITIINHTITSSLGFWILWIVYFMHQLMNAWVSEVVYPWQINEIQDPKMETMTYSRVTSLFMVNAFAFYSTLDMIFIVTAAISQVSLLCAILIANAICVTVVNGKYLEKKKYTPLKSVMIHNYQTSSSTGLQDA